MRFFSPLERRVIKRIIELHNNGHPVVLGNILEGTLSLPDYAYIAIAEDAATRAKASLLFDQSRFPEASEAIRLIDTIRLQLMGIVALFMFLEQNGYIYYVSELPTTQIGSPMEGQLYIAFDGLNLELQEFLFQHGRRRFTVTPNLEQLVKDGFRTAEQVYLDQERDHNRATKRLALSALIVSMLSVLISAVIPLLRNDSVQISGGELKVLIESRNPEEAKKTNGPR